MGSAGFCDTGWCLTPSISFCTLGAFCGESKSFVLFENPVPDSFNCRSERAELSSRRHSF